jgi:hypothetical protein
MVQKEETPVVNVTWKEPPERPSGRRFEAEAEAMRSHPGAWVLLDSYLPEEGTMARSMGNSIRIGRYTAMRPAGAFEARTATEENEHGGRTVNVYARYVGDAR